MITWPRCRLLESLSPPYLQSEKATGRIVNLCPKNMRTEKNVLYIARPGGINNCDGRVIYGPIPLTASMLQAAR